MAVYPRCLTCRAEPTETGRWFFVKQGDRLRGCCPKHWPKWKPRDLPAIELGELDG